MWVIITDLIIVWFFIGEIVDNLCKLLVFLEVVDIFNHVPGQDVLVVDQDFIDHGFGENWVEFSEDLEMGGEEGVVWDDGVDFLTDPDLVLFFMVIFFVANMHKIRNF